MRAASDALKALLASDQFYMADLYTFTLASGVVLRYADGDLDLTLDGVTFYASGALIARKGIKSTTGTTVGTLEIDIYAGMTNLVSGAPILQEIATGAFDNADLLVQRVFMATWGDTSAGAIAMFSGQISDAPQATRTSAVMTAKTYMNLLNINMPRNLYQASCSYTLYDLGCGVDRSAMAVSAVAGSGSTSALINVSTAQSSGWFSQGYVLFTSGNNANLRRTIKSSSQSQLALAYPLPYAPAAGDTMTLYPGCDHCLSTCANKFGNGARFRAMPYTPVPETAT
jgi:uncharacterized phage protein (TIGR02218 family)